MTQLQDLARQFKERQAAADPQPTEPPDLDLDAAIKARLSPAGKAEPSSKEKPEPKQQPDTHPVAKQQTESKPAAKPPTETALAETDKSDVLPVKKAPARPKSANKPKRPAPNLPADSSGLSPTTSPASDNGLPAPIRRVGTNRQRISIDVPAQFEQLRLSARKAGMSAPLLVLSALAAHGPSVSKSGTAGGVLPVVAEGVKRWPLLVSPDELSQLDQLVDEMSPALGRKSRSAVVALLLERCVN